MAYVPVPKDLTKVKTKIALNLTKRQLVCFSIAVVIGLPAYLGTKGFIGNTAAVILMIGLMLPFFFLAMYEKDGLKAEIIFRNYIRFHLWPKTRPYKTENFYQYIEKEGKMFATQEKTARAAPTKKHRPGQKKQGRTKGNPRE